MTTATIEGIRTFSFIPPRGQRFLSVNLALVDMANLLDIARELGFKPELVQIHYRSSIEIHALLWQGAISDTPQDMDEKVDDLAERVNPEAIRYAAGGWTQMTA